MAISFLLFGYERIKHMSVQIDGIIFSLQRHGGITVYFRELLTQIVATDLSSCLTLELPAKQALGHLQA